MPLNDRQKELIAKHLTFYESLDTGLREPDTALQRHFVEVCRGSCAPRTEHEMVYLAYKRDKVLEGLKTANRRRQQAREDSALSAGATATVPAIHLIDPRVPKPWSKFVHEPIGSREDFKKDSGRNWSHAQRAK
ncbi:MAG: DUF413 domain-containing protein [Alphaproteobacteria bacterium]|nr:DUF413 domain-containing protein [Alphaproteobacteria bacterium]